MNSAPFTVSLICWHDAEPLLRAIREAVFIHEQGVPKALEWDGVDPDCRHALVLASSAEAIGCGRMLNDGHIGRVAVMPQWRKQKVGTAIMESLLNEARALGYPTVEVDAQLHAMSFYQHLGFVEYGEEFMDAGLPHIKMRLALLPR